MHHAKGYINIGIIVLLIISVLAVGAFIKKNYFSQNTILQASNNQTSNYGFRFDTQYGGQFDINYPLKYFSGQDYFNKSVNFKLTDCQEKCETLIVAATKRDLSGAKDYTIEGKDYTLKKIANSDGSTTLLINPKWTDRLGLIEIKSYLDIDEPSDDFNKIIGSLQFVKEIEIKKAQQPSSSTVLVPTSLPSPVQTSSSNKPVLIQTTITTIAPIDLSANYLSQTKVFNSSLFSLRYPNNWELISRSDYFDTTFYDPAGAEKTYSHAGTIYKNSIDLTEAIMTTQSAEDYMKVLDTKRSAAITRSYESWQESKAKDPKYPEYVQSAWDQPYSNKQKIVKGNVEYIIYYDNSASSYYFIVSNRKVLIQGRGKLINDRNSIERKILESITPN